MCLIFTVLSLTSASLTAGTEKLFSLFKLGYLRRRVGRRLLLILSHKRNLYLTVIPACHVPLACGAEERHESGYVSCYCVFVFEITYCCFNFYSSFKVLFIADAKISFDSFRSAMAATVNSKTIITVNPGKMLRLITFTLIVHLHKKKAENQPTLVCSEGGGGLFFLQLCMIFKVRNTCQSQS